MVKTTVMCTYWCDMCFIGCTPPDQDVCFTKHLIVINHKLWKFNFKSYLLFLYLLITPVTPCF